MATGPELIDIDNGICTLKLHGDIPSTRLWVSSYVISPVQVLTITHVVMMAGRVTTLPLAVDQANIKAQVKEFTDFTKVIGNPSASETEWSF